MRQPLKERIQNAINQAVLHEEVAYGALIVGGRRVTRKKRRPKPAKKDQNNNTKKNNKKQTEKNKKYFKLVEEEREAKVALIEKEDGEENNIVIDIGEKTAEDGGGVKEESVKLDVKDDGVTSSTEGGDVNAVNHDVSTNNADDSGTTGGAGGDAGSIDDKKNENNGEKDDVKTADAKSEINEEKVKSVKDAVKEIEGEDGGGVKSAAVNGTVMKSEKTSVKGGSDQEKDQSKEKSPLIEKESNVKDTGPGVLCCNIL